jgi:hypothetical protein
MKDSNFHLTTTDPRGGPIAYYSLLLTNDASG